MQNLTFRLATDKDFDSIIQIWEENIIEMYALRHEELTSHKNTLKQLFETREEYHNFWVAETNNDKSVLGWQAFSPIFSTPLKKSSVVESSTFIHKDFQKTGIAYDLMTYALQKLSFSDISFVYGFIDKYNQGAIKLVNKIGFIEIGTLPAIASVSPHFFENILFLYQVKSEKFYSPIGQ